MLCANESRFINGAVMQADDGAWGLTPMRDLTPSRLGCWRSLSRGSDRPRQLPLSVNALASGCNQKTARDLGDETSARPRSRRRFDELAACTWSTPSAAAAWCATSTTAPAPRRAQWLWPSDPVDARGPQTAAELRAIPSGCTVCRRVVGRRIPRRTCWPRAADGGATARAPRAWRHATHLPAGLAVSGVLRRRRYLRGDEEVCCCCMPRWPSCAAW